MVLCLSGDPEEIRKLHDIAVESGLEIKVYSELPLYYKDSSLEADFENREVHIHGSKISLGKRQSAALRVLVSKPGHIWSTEKLENLVLGSEDFDPKYIDVIIGRLRKRIKDNPLEPLIQTVKDKYNDNGYRYNPPLEEQKYSQ